VSAKAGKNGKGARVYTAVQPVDILRRGVKTVLWKLTLAVRVSILSGSFD
jgi:hypothetical protein